MIRALLLALATLALAACSEASKDVAKPGPSPALWEIVGHGGAVEGWIFGTIHALPDDVEWRTALLEDRLVIADLLVVEVAALEDAGAMQQMFATMAFGRPPSPVAGRIDPDLRDELAELLTEARLGPDHFDAMESWAAGLALAQLAQTGDVGNGVDRALLSEFEGGEVIELEGARAQLAIFDSLPEKEQRDLIEAVLIESAARKDDIGALARTWQAGNLDGLNELTRQGILADPELKQALLTARNRAWAAQVTNLLSTSQRPFVAVGAGHLLGPEGLPALIEESGYTVRRIQ